MLAPDLRAASDGHRVEAEHEALASQIAGGDLVDHLIWLNNQLRDLAGDMLAPDRLRAQGIFDADEAGWLLAEHWSGRRDNRKGLWTFLEQAPILPAAKEVAINVLRTGGASQDNDNRANFAD